MRELIPLMVALTIAAPLYAQSKPPVAAAASVMSDGVVRKIDAASGKLTLRHGPIVNLDMPGMTMVFRVQSPALLNGVKEGDTVKFHVENIKGAFTVTQIQVVR